MYVTFPLFLSDFHEKYIFLTDFINTVYSNIKFHENPTSGSRDVPYATNRKTDMTKLINAFRSFAIVPKKKKPQNMMSLIQVLS